MTRIRCAFAAAILVLIMPLGGCDARVELVEEEEAQAAVRLEERVADLERRVDGIEGNVDGLRETTVVQSESGLLVLRMNTQTAAVAIALILGVVALLLGWMRMHAARRGAEPPEEGGAAPGA